MQVDIILGELTFKAVRSGGPGGQHVNKTASKVEVVFDLLTSKGLDDSEKELLTTRLASRISSKGQLVVQSSESRSQHRNKRIGIERMIALLARNLKVAKPRKRTRPSKGAIEKRLHAKKKKALKKSHRRPPKIE